MTTGNKQSVLTVGQILTLDWRSNMTNDEIIRFARAVESAVVSKLRGAGEPVAWMTDDGRTANAASRQGMHEITKASFCIPLYAAPQASANKERIRQLEAECSALHAARFAYASEFPSNAEGDPDVDNIHANIRALKAQTSAEEVAEGARDVALPKLPKPRNGRTHYARKDIMDYARAAVLADRQQRDGDARDAERWREVERQATKKTAYDRYGNGAYWSVGVFSDDSRQTFGETIDAAIAQQGKEGA